MSNTEIQEGNKLIAEFMGKKENSDAIYLYHDQWNYLMPVVEKINNWNDEKSDDYFELLLDYEFDPLRILDLKITNPIKFIWQAVIDFIQWYNQNKTP